MLQKLRQLRREYNTWSSRPNGLGFLAGMVAAIPMLIFGFVYKPTNFVEMLPVLSIGLLSFLLFMRVVFLIEKTRGLTVSEQSQLSDY